MLCDKKFMVSGGGFMTQVEKVKPCFWIRQYPYKSQLFHVMFM